jgi:hypothetical protein
MGRRASLKLRLDIGKTADDHWQCAACWNERVVENRFAAVLMAAGLVVS